MMNLRRSDETSSRRTSRCAPGQDNRLFVVNQPPAPGKTCVHPARGFVMKSLSETFRGWNREKYGATRDANCVTSTKKSGPKARLVILYSNVVGGRPDRRCRRRQGRYFIIRGERGVSFGNKRQKNGKFPLKRKRKRKRKRKARHVHHDQNPKAGPHRDHNNRFRWAAGGQPQ